MVRAPDCSTAEPRRRQKKGTDAHSKRKGRAKKVANTRNDVAIKCYDAKKFKRLGLWKKLRNDKKDVESIADTVPKVPDDAYDEWQHQKNVALKYFRLPNMIPVDKEQPPQPERLPGSDPTLAPRSPSEIKNTPQVITILNKKGVIVNGGYGANLKPRHTPEPGKVKKVVIDVVNSEKRGIDLRSAPTSAIVDLTVDQTVRDSTSGPKVLPDDPLAVVPNIHQGSGDPQQILNGYYARPAASGLPGTPGVLSGDTNTPVNILPATGSTTGNDPMSIPNIRPAIPPLRSLAPQIPLLTPMRPHTQARGVPAHVASDSRRSFVHLGGIKNTAGELSFFFPLFSFVIDDILLLYQSFF